ncbi:MAG: AAA family ATPase [Desulfatirhabdiaceae bacterium]
MIIGFLYSLKKLPERILYLFKRFLTMSLEINNKDGEYSNFIIWCERFNSQNLRSYHFNSLTRNANRNPYRFDSETESSNYSLSLGAGSHFVWYKGRLLHIHKEQHHENTEGIIEKVKITTFGITSRFIVRIYQEILDVINNIEYLKLYINCDGFWEITTKQKRRLDKFIYKEKDRIISQLREFLIKRDWYLERGLMHKKGILLSGKPGTGKSTFACVIASEFNLNLYYLNLSQEDTIKNLEKLIGDVKENSIILLEDIDCLFMTKNREDIETNEKMSGLLNILDGVTSPNGNVIYILTTNYIDRIDKAIIRPGRVDIRIEMKYFDMVDLKSMYQIYYETGFDEFYDSIRQVCDLENISPACFQNIFVSFPDVADLITEIRSNPEGFILDFIR